MLMHPLHTLHAGDVVELQLRPDGGEIIPVTPIACKQ